MVRRLGIVAVFSLLASLLAGLPQQAASADPPLGFGYWPRCASSGYPTVDTDNRYCVVSYQKNTGAGWVTVPPPDWDTNGTYDDPYVDALRTGDASSPMTAMRFGLYETTVSSGGVSSDADVDPLTHWRYVVNTGSMHPRELYGNTRNTDFSVVDGGAAGWRLTLTFRPSPIAWRWPPNDPTKVCVPGNCGDSSTVADLVRDGFVTGYVTDLVHSGLDPSEILDRTGMIRAWNADYASDPYYNPDLNALEIQLANVHWKTPVEVATGYYEVFLPGRYLTRVLQVPDPSTLTGGSFTISRVGSSTTVPFALTHESGGVRIVIHSITFSSPKFRIRPRPTVPGQPRWGSVSRPTATKVKLSFYRPLADGGPNIDVYQGRCRRGTAPWTYVKATRSPIYIANLPRRVVDCQVRAHNRIGWGRWSVVRRG